MCSEAPFSSSTLITTSTFLVGFIHRSMYAFKTRSDDDSFSSDTSTSYLHIYGKSRSSLGLRPLGGRSKGIKSRREVTIGKFDPSDQSLAFASLRRPAHYIDQNDGWRAPVNRVGEPASHFSILLPLNCHIYLLVPYLPTSRVP